MRDGAATPRIDGVLLADASSVERVAGMRLVERAAFTLARAGVTRLLCIGVAPPGDARLPAVPLTCVRSVGDADAVAWLRTVAPVAIVLDAATVVDRATVVALAASVRGAVLRTAEARLWGAPGDAVPTVLARGADGVGDESAGAPAPFARWTPPPNAIVVAAHDARGRTAAAARLFASVGRPGDGWFTRLVDRRISRVITRALLPTGATPNAVTLASIAIGLVAAALFATGRPVAAVAGALLFLASTIIDGCDGELARLTFRESAFGAKLDVVGDNVVHLFLFAGIAAGLYRRHPDPRVAAAGALLVCGVVASMAAVYLSFVRREPTSRQRALFEAFASREFAYLLVALTLAGKLEWFLWLSVVGTYAFVAGLVLLRR